MNKQMKFGVEREDGMCGTLPRKDAWYAGTNEAASEHQDIVSIEEA